MNPDFSKYPDGLIPAIVQDHATQKVLMLAYMNEDALKETQEKGRVTFYSRSRKALWTKGSTSGNYLTLISIQTDCDSDCLLIQAIPAGPVCHTGTDTCFNEANIAPSFLSTLEQIIASRQGADPAHSYTASLFAKGINKIAQKVGEEAVEVVIEAKDNNRERFLNETADLLFHLLILMRAKDVTLQDVNGVLTERHTRAQ